VLLPGLHRTLRGNDRGLLLWEEVLLDDADSNNHEHLTEALIVAPLPRRKPAKGAPPSAYDYLQEFEKRRSAHEGQRVLYVAVTRARRQLHLLSKVKPSDKEGEVCKAPAKNTALAQLWPALGPQFEAKVTEQLGQTQAPQNLQPMAETPYGEAAPFQPWLLRLAQPSTSTDLPIPPGAIKEDAGNNAIQALEESHALEAHVGTLVHRYLEIWAKDDLAQWNETRIQSLKPRLIHWLAQQGHAPQACAAGASKAVLHLSTTLASETGRWLLSHHQEASSELALTSISESRPVAQAVDRSFMDQGQRWIVDYKTAEPGGQDKAEFIAEQIALYRVQLADYAKLLGKSSGKGATVRCALFFTGWGELVAVT